MKLNFPRFQRRLAFVQLQLASALCNWHRFGWRGKAAVPLSEGGVDLEGSAAAGFQRLRSRRVDQFTPAACSVASVAAVLNAARLCQRPDADSPPVTQEALLDRIPVGHWRERISPAGYRHRRGLPIELLGKVVTRTLAAYRIDCRSIDVVALNSGMPDLDRRREALQRRLNGFAQTADTFMIAHFNQGLLVGGLHLPHISPLGAYDRRGRRVLMLDVDPEQPEPYWVPFDTFFDALAWDYHGILKKFGYVGGGYVRIRLAA